MIGCTDEELDFLKEEYEGQDCPEAACLDELLHLRANAVREWEMEEFGALEDEVVELKKLIKELATYIRTNNGNELLHRLRLRGLL